MYHYIWYKWDNLIYQTGNINQLGKKEKGKRKGKKKKNMLLMIYIKVNIKFFLYINLNILKFIPIIENDNILLW